MIHALIDNCSLRDLIGTHGFSIYLTQLEDFINRDKVRFVTHQLVIEEWESHKATFRKQKTKKLLGNRNNLYFYFYTFG